MQPSALPKSSRPALLHSYRISYCPLFEILEILIQCNFFIPINDTNKVRLETKSWSKKKKHLKSKDKINWSIPFCRTVSSESSMTGFPSFPSRRVLLSRIVKAGLSPAFSIKFQISWGSSLATHLWQVIFPFLALNSEIRFFYPMAAVRLLRVGSDMMIK